MLNLSLSCAHANSHKKKNPLESILWDQTLDKMACVIHSLGNLPLDSVLNVLFKVFSFCFLLLCPVKETQTVV